MFLLFATASAQSQVLEMTEFYADVFDISAKSDKYKRMDANQELCALIRIQLPVTGCEFKGDVVDTRYDVNEYWVYMPHGTYKLVVKCSDCETLQAD